MGHPPDIGVADVEAPSPSLSKVSKVDEDEIVFDKKISMNIIENDYEDDYEEEDD